MTPFDLDDPDDEPDEDDEDDLEDDEDDGDEDGEGEDEEEDTETWQVGGGARRRDSAKGRLPLDFGWRTA